MALISRGDNGSQGFIAAIDNFLDANVMQPLTANLDAVTGMGVSSQSTSENSSMFAGIPGLGAIFGSLSNCGVAGGQHVDNGNSGYFAAAATNIATMRDAPNALLRA